MKAFNAIFFTVLVALVSVPAAQAGEGSWDVAASLDLQSRYFSKDARWPGQASMR